MCNRLAHDAAFFFAQQVLSLVAHLLREEEHKDACAEFYRLATEATARYAEDEERQRKRLRPKPK